MKKTYGILVIAFIYLACSKPDEPAPTPPSPPNPPAPAAQTCIISGIAHRNSGSKAEFALSVGYNAVRNPTSIVVFDSAANSLVFSASLNWVTLDSIRIDQYQYIKLDTAKRVSMFVTKSDMTKPGTADDYRYEYLYNSDGLLITKNLYVNGGKTPSYISSYTYGGSLLIGFTMKTGNGNQKLMESTLTYDLAQSPKTMLYTFPDGFEISYYTAVLNFGKRPVNPLAQVVTKIYNTANAALLDTWTTNYSGYTLDSNGYMTSCNATGDQQQGIAGFYGKTYFSYQCQ